MRPMMMLAPLLLAAACGGSIQSQQLADYRAASGALDAVVDAHASSGAAVAPATCAASMSDYARQAGDLIGRMQSMSGSMDQCMGSLGKPDHADFGTGCTAIRSELDAHSRDGCSAADRGSEMARHVAAMKAHGSRERDRMGEMEGAEQGMSSSMMNGRAGCR